MFRSILPKIARSQISKRSINLNQYESFYGKYGSDKLKNTKTTTGYTGLMVEPEASRILPILYNRVIQVLEDNYPVDSTYRSTMVGFYKERQALFENAENLRAFEDATGQPVELTIFDVRDEINLATGLHYEAPWGELMEQAPEGQWIWP